MLDPANRHPLRSMLSCDRQPRFLIGQMPIMLIDSMPSGPMSRDLVVEVAVEAHIAVEEAEWSVWRTEPQ